ncbi:MAG: ABC transporter ATP-binding protein [Bdellovibrionaceae bacterium]|nr:ABC transporter ATP-binding protein [Pseudobdellovibrionaceae bacterium]
MHDSLVRVNTRQVLRRIVSYVGRHPWVFTLIVASVFATAAASRALPWIIGQIIDRAVLPKNNELFLRLAFLYLGMEIVKTVFQFIQTYQFQKFGNRMLFYVREDLYRHVLNLPLDFFNRTPVGRVVTRMTNDVGSIGELFTDGVVAVFTQGVVLIATVVAMSLISWKLTLLTLITAPVYIYVTYRVTVRIRLLLHDTKAKLSAMNAFLAENISGIKVIQLYNKTGRQNARFFQLSEDYRLINLRMIKSYALLQPVLNLFNATLITSALYLGGYFHLQDALPLGLLVTFIMYAQDFIHPIRDILEKVQQFQNSLTSAERVFTLLEEPEETDRAGELNSALRGEIEIRDLSFSYRPDLPPALKNISMKILPGESVALVGRTGSGKTTMISLLQRFYDVPAGTMWIDGQAIETIPRQALRRRLGVIQQDPVLFRGTLEFNITLGHPEIPLERVELACRRVGLKLPLALAIEERGGNLSLGERQLVAFARIFAFDPEILILDEATANIDSETEQLLKKATDEVTQGRTSLVIAHRLSTIEHCDRVVVLDQGTIAETGTPAELLARGGLYAQLASAGLKSMRIAESADGIADP